MTPLLLIVATFYLAGSVSKGQFPEQDTGLIWGRASSSATAVSAAFKAFAWRFANIVSSALVTLGQRPTFDLCNRSPAPG